MDRRTETELPNTLGFDLEHWHSATLLADAVESPVDHIEDSIDIVLSILESFDVTATFFVVGELALAYPALIQRVHDAGHELASHGHTHTPLFELTPREFEDELTQSASAIERVAGVKPDGFRAPNFSVTTETDWVLDVLDSSDYRYDSSVFPRRTPMYGVAGAPRTPYVVPEADPFRTPIDDESVRDLIEVPMSVAGRRARIPIAGGFYARVLPSPVIERAIQHLQSRGQPANLYFHPWEFNETVRTSEPALQKRFISFVGIERTAAKLERLLERFEWQPVGEVVDAVSEERNHPEAERAT